MSTEKTENIPNFTVYNPDNTPPATELNSEQVQKLKELTKLVNEKLAQVEELTQPVLLRYLVANKWNVLNAFHGLSATLVWRKEFKVSGLYTKEFLEEGATGKIYCNGFAKDNSPILYMNPARQNTSDSTAHVRFTVYSVELALRMLPPGVEKLTVLIDLRDYSLKTAVSFSESRQILSIFSNHYPERLEKVIMLDAPWVFSSFFKMISPFIDPVTRNKILFSSLSKKDNGHISNFIHKGTIYKEFGGDSTFEYNGPVFFEHAEKFFR